MFNKPIEQMDFNELRSTVQYLFDAFAIMQRKYEDLLNNLSRENFSGIFTKEIDGMKTSIAVTEEGIKTAVKNTEELGNELRTNYSTTEQTSSLISSKVASEVENEIKGKLENYSTIEQTADGILSSVVSNIDEDAIKMVDDISEMTKEDVIYGIYQYDVDDNKIGRTLYHYNTEFNKWMPLQGTAAYSIFKQTKKGFVFIGDVQIDGDAIIDGTLSADKLNGRIANVSESLTIGEGEGDYAEIVFNNGDTPAIISYDPKYDQLKLSAYSVKISADNIYIGHNNSYVEIKGEEL